MKAVWITPSAAAAPLRRLLISSSEPRCTSALAAARDAAAASERERPRTSCPAAISSLTMTEPMNPVAPVKKTRIRNLPGLDEGHCRFAVYPGKVVTLYGYID